MSSGMIDMIHCASSNNSLWASAWKSVPSFSHPREEKKDQWKSHSNNKTRNEQQTTAAAAHPNLTILSFPSKRGCIAAVKIPLSCSKKKESAQLSLQIILIIIIVQNDVYGEINPFMLSHADFDIPQPQQQSVK